MTESTNAPGPDASVDDLQAGIERTRADLGDTVTALGEKLDVKAQIKGSADQAKADAANLAAQTKDQIMSSWPEIAIVAVTAALIVLAWKRT